MTTTLTQATKAAVQSQKQFLTFTLDGRTLAIPIDNVREIIEFSGMTEVPMMPDFVRGVINLRGAVVPVIDLQRRFGKETTSIGKRTCVVIAEVPHAEATHLLGAIVDGVNEVLTVDESRIEPKPGFGTGLRQDFVEGLINLEGRFVVALDISNALSVEEMADLVAVSERSPQLQPA